jgi:hypothetical protein
MMIDKPKAKEIVVPPGRYAEPIFIQAYPKQKIVIERVEITIVKDVSKVHNGHPIQVSGLGGPEGDKPTDCPVDLSIRFNTIVLTGKGKIFDDAISVISVQGTKDRPMLVSQNTIQGHFEYGDGSDTAICFDRATAHFRCTANRIGDDATPFVSGNSAIVSAGGSEGWIMRNRIRGRSLLADRSAIAAYNAYPGDGERKNVRVPVKGANANDVQWGPAGPVWNDLLGAKE